MNAGSLLLIVIFFFFFQAEDGIRDDLVTGVQTCALPISYEKLYAFFASAMRKAGQSFSPERDHLNITPMLGGFLRSVGCTGIQQKAHVIDFSIGTEDYEAFRQNWVLAFKLLQPFCLKLGTETQEELDRFYD